MRIAFYSPDRHIVYDGSTPDLIGVGGGITVRIRMAAALAARGHEVQVVCNCPARICCDGVEYKPLDSVQELRTDVLIAHSTGGAFDLTPLGRLNVEANLRILVVSGIDEAAGWEEFRAQAITTPGDYVSSAVRRAWRTRPPRIFACPYGIIPQDPATWARRSIRSLIYTSHPSKGLAAAIGVIRLLLQQDTSWNLHVFGGNRLWGGHDEPVNEPGVEYHGLIPQSRLHGIYPRFGFALHLQRRLEPFGLTLVEAQGAGCVAIASPAGAYSEIVQDGCNGFLMNGDPDTESVQRAAAAVIQSLGSSPDLFARISETARCSPHSWQTIAEAWETWMESEFEPPKSSAVSCAVCKEKLLLTAVGCHCVTCGTYRRLPTGPSC